MEHTEVPGIFSLYCLVCEQYFDIEPIWLILQMKLAAMSPAKYYTKKFINLNPGTLLFRIATVKANILRNEERISRMIATIGVGSK